MVFFAGAFLAGAAFRVRVRSRSGIVKLSEVGAVAVRARGRVLRWTAAGMLNAERSFRRIKGHKQMPQLVTALHRHAHPKTAEDTDTVGAAA